MIKVNVVPLSVNACWQGRRYKTPEYEAYEKIVLLTLRPMKIPDQPLLVIIELGFSSKLSDIDNAIKPILDILQKKYSFNDRDIFELEVKKKIVSKGSEYFAFEIYGA